MTAAISVGMVAVVFHDQRRRCARRGAGIAARRREIPPSPRAMSLQAMPSSLAIATAASALSTLWRPGTESCSVPSSTARPPGRARRARVHTDPKPFSCTSDAP